MCKRQPAPKLPATAPKEYSAIALCKGARSSSLNMAPCSEPIWENNMFTTNRVPISELSDAEPDSVSAGTGWTLSFKQVSANNVAVQVAANNQANAAFINILSSQGSSQNNNNNAGNQG